jgi:hypothetical protein
MQALPIAGDCCDDCCPTCCTVTGLNALVAAAVASACASAVGSGVTIVETIADLRLEPVPLTERLAVVTGTNQLFTYDAASLCVDNGASCVLPDTIPATDPGRWVQVI